MKLDSIPKGAEFTYGVHSAALLDVAPDNAATIMHPAIATEALRQLEGAMMGSVRGLNEKFGLFRQGIAYSLPWIRNAEGEIEFLVYNRRKTNNEGQLAMRLSLAPGGHIERPDLHYHVTLCREKETLVDTDILDLVGVLGKNLQREMAEEVHFTPPEGNTWQDRDIGIYSTALAQPCGIVYDTKPEHGYVGNIHFGALVLVPIPAGTSFEMKEVHNLAVGWVKASQLREWAESGLVLEEGTAHFEPWSKMVIDQIDLVENVINDIWPL